MLSAISVLADAVAVVSHKVSHSLTLSLTHLLALSLTLSLALLLTLSHMLSLSSDVTVWVQGVTSFSVLSCGANSCASGVLFSFIILPVC